MDAGAGASVPTAVVFSVPRQPLASELEADTLAPA
jgi:hypothetical protein